MKVFVTGATGFIGSAVVKELLAAGHQVLGLARSDERAASLAATGAEVHRGDLEDLESLRSGAAAADGVIHTAYDHAFTDMVAAGGKDKRAIDAIGDVLAGSGRPLVVAAGIAGLSLGQVLTEDDAMDPNSRMASIRQSELAALGLVSRGVRASAVRLSPTVHGEGDHGFVRRLVEIARAKGVSAYPGEGLNRWPAVHRLDAAHLFRLVLENAPGGTRAHGVADEGVQVRDIAEVIGRHLNIPVVSLPAGEVNEHFGWLGAFFSLDLPASSALTQQRLDWHPVQPGLLEDLDQGHYFSEM